MKTTLLFSLSIVLLFTSCKKEESQDPNNAQDPNSTLSTFTDPRDGQTYNIVQIGNQTWFAENLNYQTSNSWCYDDLSSNCDTYGRLYTWDAAQTACPNGWHLPSENEWSELINYLGGAGMAGGKMKSLNTWDSPNVGATNASGFSGLAAGWGTNANPNPVFFGQMGTNTWWWSSSETPPGSVYPPLYYALSYGLVYNIDTVYAGGYTSKIEAISCRCLED